MRAVLTYHSIDPSGSPISVDREVFERHVGWLASGVVRVVPLTEILSISPGRDAVAVTFDDALETFGSVAAPLLVEAGLPVTVFVVSDRVGGTNHWGHPGDALVPEMDLLGWDALGRLQDDGVELGAHTRTHPDLTALEGDDVLRDELEGCARRMEAETGRRPRAFAYPFGHHDERCVEAVGGLYDVAVTTELRTLDEEPDPRRLPRLDMFYFRRPGLLESWGSTAFRRYLWIRRAGRRLRAAALRGGGS